jgi:hypothetical protein
MPHDFLDPLKGLLVKWRYDEKDPECLRGVCPSCSPPSLMAGELSIFVRVHGGVASVNCCDECSLPEVVDGLRRVARETIVPSELWHYEVDLAHLERTGHFGRPLLGADQ